MNAMGHDFPTLIGVDQRGLAERIGRAAPGYMAMGEAGMADMSAMAMRLPPNTLPMMGGDGQYGSLEMGGMFSVVKVRRDQKPGDYSDPGWYAHPAGTVAHAVDTPADAVRAPDTGVADDSLPQAVRGQSGHGGHEH
jgi:hypothetical protein